MRADITVEQANQYFPKKTILDVAVTCPVPGAAGTGAQLVSRAQAGIQGRKLKRWYVTKFRSMEICQEKLD